jgi:signal peptidase I
MTMQPEAVSPSRNGTTKSVVVEPAVLRSPLPTTSRTKRSSDYRLRGLDLDAAGIAERPARPARQMHPSRRRHRRRLIIKWLIVLTVVASTAVFMRAAVVQPFSVTSTSMVPTLQPGTDVLVVKPRALTGGIHAGDIVVFRQPEGASCGVTGSSRHLVSRVIALPGQTIWSEDDTIFIDGERLDEPSWHNPPFGELGTNEISRTEIPSGSYFVLGDNRTDTCDSRVFGPVDGSLLVGEVVATTARGGHPSVHIL